MPSATRAPSTTARGHMPIRPGSDSSSTRKSSIHTAAPPISSTSTTPRSSASSMNFGIYGGPAGAHILALLKEVRMPVVTTLHTVLREPDSDQRMVMEELARRSDRLVVMARKGAEILRETYGIPDSKIDIIPHGIPDIPFADSGPIRRSLAFRGAKSSSHWAPRSGQGHRVRHRGVACHRPAFSERHLPRSRCDPSASRRARGRELSAGPREAGRGSSLAKV